jgi:lycopene cyclase CruA
MRYIYDDIFDGSVRRTMAVRTTGTESSEEIAARYPRTAAAFATMPGGAAALAAVARLEARWRQVWAGPPPARVLGRARGALPMLAPADRFDVVIAGGGLGLVMGWALAQAGWRVLVFDRDAVGCAHREWNISRAELDVLVAAGLFTWAELEGAVATTYREGLIRFDATGTGAPAVPLRLAGVLDLALDAQAVLDLARARFLAAGGTIRAGRRFRQVITAARGPARSHVRLDGPAGPETVEARLVIDMMGSISPIALTLNAGRPFDGVCPTVGTVVAGLGGDPGVGDILVSVAGTQAGRQLIWEGFPGRHGETTVYVFYYDLAGPGQAPRQSLLALFEQYFTLLPSYAQSRIADCGLRNTEGDQGSGVRGQGSNNESRNPQPATRNPQSAVHLRPVYGYIPARHGRRGRTAARGVVCLGDAAAGQSPLTFCGFGSFVRHLPGTRAALDAALRADRLEARDLARVGPHQANLRPAWAFARLMQPWPGGGPAAVNRLLNAFCAALVRVGAPTTKRFLQDRHTFRDYLHILLTTARLYPAVFPITWRVLGPRGLVRWLRDIAAFGLARNEGVKRET